MDLSPIHAALRAEAARVPALQASLALLNLAPGPAVILLYAGPRPAPGEAPAGAALATLALAAVAGTIDTEARQLVLAVPIEAQIAVGGEAAWARVIDGAGEWWSDASVSVVGEGGEIQLDDTTLYAGAIVRLISGVFQG